MNRLIHIASEGERWDLLAFRYYGSVYEMERIIAANPHIPIAPHLPGGTRVFIPIIPEAELDGALSLPPWVV